MAKISARYINLPVVYIDFGIDLATPVVETRGSEAKSKFTGKISRVTIEVGKMKAADREKEEKLRRETAHKMAMSD